MTDAEKPFIVSLRPVRKYENKDFQACFDIINVPLTEITEPQDIERRVSEIVALEPDSIVLTSSVSSEILLKYAKKDFLKGLKNIFCVGTATETPLSSYRTVIPPEGRRNVNGLTDLILSKKAVIAKTAVFRSSEGDPRLVERIMKAGIDAVEFISYSISKKDPAALGKYLESDSFRGFIATSPMEAQILSEYLARYQKFQQLKYLIFAIGEPTKKVIENSGFVVSKPFGDSDFDRLINEIRREFCSNSGEWI